MLNEGQQAAFEGVTKGNKQISFITGEAGTGKTWVASEITKYFMQEKGYSNIIALAPSHAAKNILNATVKDWGIETNTIHSHCNFIPKGLDSSNNTIFKWSDKLPADKDVVIIDEAGMVSKDIFEVLLMSKIKHIILLGDENQLSAVASVGIDFSDIPTYRLTEQMRQKSKLSQLAKLIDKFKVAIEAEELPDLDDIESDDSLQLLRSCNIPKVYIDTQTSSKVCLAATNAAVNRYNKAIKNLSTENSKDLFSVGDTLVLQQPWWNAYNKKDPAVLNNGALIVLTNITPSGFDNYINVEFEEVENGGWYSALLPLKQYQHKNLLNQMATSVKTGEGRWVDFFKAKNETLNVKHTFAMTAWKSQGSTYDEVIIDHADIVTILNWPSNTSDKESKLLMYLKAMYVALSRAKHKVTIKL